MSEGLGALVGAVRTAVWKCAETVHVWMCGDPVHHDLPDQWRAGKRAGCGV